MFIRLLGVVTQHYVFSLIVKMMRGLLYESMSDDEYFLE